MRLFSAIRETMVRLMTGPVSPWDAGSTYGRNREGAFHDVPLTATACASSELPKDPSTCIFWCAIALGALVRGRPLESVARYVEMAKEALGRFSGPPTNDVVRAWTILAYVYGFCGDLVGFQGCLQSADYVMHDPVTSAPNDQLPVGFNEIVKHRETVKFFTGEMGREEVASFCNEEITLTHLSDFATEGEIYCFVMKSYRAFEQAVYGHVYKARGTLEDCTDNGEDTKCSESGLGEPIQTRRHPCPTVTDEHDGPQDDTHDVMVMRLKEHSCGFERLEHAVDRPNIRGGIGGLIINGSLVFEKAAKKDIHGVIESLHRCIEVFERYPGLCRFTMGSHISHMMMSVVAGMDDPRSRGLYEKLRAAYNPMRPVGYRPAPPFEEWSGVSRCCDHFYCKAIEGLLASEELAFNVPPPPQPTEEAIDVGIPTSASGKLGSVFSGHVLERAQPTTDTSCGTARGHVSGEGCGLSGSIDSEVYSTWSARIANVPEKVGQPRPGIDTPAYATSFLETRGQQCEGAQDLEVVSVTYVEEALRGQNEEEASVLGETLRSSGFGVALAVNSEENEEDAIAAADWLDVTLAMLGDKDKVL